MYLPTSKEGFSSTTFTRGLLISDDARDKTFEEPFTDDRDKRDEDGDDWEEDEEVKLGEEEKNEERDDKEE